MPKARFDFQDVMARARHGDEVAIGSIVETYSPYVRRIVRHRLAKEARRVVDSVDIVQSVWRSFFSHGLPGHDFADHRQLLQFLLGMSRHKVIDANRRYLDSQQLDLRRVYSLDELSATEQDRLVDPHPSPPETAEEREALEWLSASLPPRYRDVIVLLFEGYSHQEIAERVGCTERTVRRILSYIHRYRSDPSP